MVFLKGLITGKEKIIVLSESVGSSERPRERE
jgi:hypothetical protein